MKILYLTGQLVLHGGIERVTSMKLNYLAEHTSNEVYLCTYEQGNAPFVYEISPKVVYCDLGVNYNVDYTNESLYSVRQFKKVPKHILRTRKLISEINPDIIVVPNFGFEYQFLPFIKQGAKIIREFHDSQYRRSTIPSIKDKVNNWIQRLYDAVVVLTPQEKDYFIYKQNLVVIPNPIKKNQEVSIKKKKTIISVGRIDPVKGFDKLIEIASKVKKKCPYCKFEIYGVGEENYINSLKKKTEQAQVSSVLRFMGRTDDVYAKMLQSVIYVCTSKTESFGLTLVEAQECGLPVVSFDCPNGPRNIVHDGVDGFLILQNDVTQAANAIIYLLENEDFRYRMATNARHNAQQFHIVKIMNKWEELFKQLIQNKYIKK